MFEKYLAEAKKVYEFKIGVAGEMSEDFTDSLEGCLQRYSVASMSPGKKTPIQECPLDFPKLQNIEVTHYEVALNYPTTPQVLGEYIAQCCNCSPANIVVRSVNDPIEAYQEPKDDAPYEARLTKEEMESESAQEDVSGARVMGLLKELEVARKERDNPVAATKESFATEASDIKQMDTTANIGTKSPIGS